MSRPGTSPSATPGLLTGDQLARIEGQDAFGALLARFPGIKLAHRRSTLVRGLRTLR